MENVDVGIYIRFFCRITVIFLFAFSFITKVFDINEYVSSIRRFNIIPLRFSKIAAVIFTLLEGLIVLLLISDINFQLIGFGIAFVVLLTFTFAIGSALMRGMRISCNCFGSSETRISSYDILRNLLFIIFTVIGAALLIDDRNTLENIFLIEGIIVSFWAIAFIVISTHLSNIASLFQQNPGNSRK